MRLYIDDKEVETDLGQSVSVSLSIASVTDPESGRTGYSKTLKVPATTANAAIFGDCAGVHSTEMFNSLRRSARIEVDGCVIIRGTARLARYESFPDGGGWYHINILGQGREWIDMASATSFSALAVPFSENITPSAVASGWRGDSPVKFFPVKRESLTMQTDNFQGGVRVLSFRDYHPFIRMRNIVEAIASQAGYTIKSKFIEGEFFGSLYMSGRYPERDVSAQAQSYGFTAGRFAAKAAVADSFGRVYADPWNSGAESLGNIVDSADPEDFPEPSGGIHNNNRVFAKEGVAVCFRPAKNVRAGFEYNLRYRSDYVIKDRNRLGCFDRVYLDDMYEREFRVINRNEDRRSAPKGGFSYRVVVFGHVKGNQYRLSAVPADGSGVFVVKSFTERSTEAVIVTPKSLSGVKLEVLSGGSYVEYPQDWALYDGYVTERGQIDIQLTVSSAVQEIASSSPRYFNLIHFGGAEQGMTMTLSEKTTLKPYFTEHPVQGSSVSFADVADYDIPQSDVIKALRHMFNLCFYTDSISKVIYIEPRWEFYCDKIVDWSGRTDCDRPVSVEELGAELNERLLFRYLRGDIAAEEKMGDWSAAIDNVFAGKGVKEYVNPIFSPALSSDGVYPDAPGASLIEVGTSSVGGEENLNFSARIVRFEGMKNLAECRWGWPEYGNSYPKIAFHSAGGGVVSGVSGEEPYTLCFDDRDSVPGLHRYYDKNIEMYNTGKRITVYLHLEPVDIEPLVTITDLREDFRALFRIKIDGEEVLCRLEEISDFNPGGGGSTKCVFIKNI